MRQVERKRAERVVVVTHSPTIRCFVMRFLHLTVEQFETILNPHNCDIITLSDRGDLPNPQFTRAHWGVGGLRLQVELALFAAAAADEKVGSSRAATDAAPAAALDGSASDNQSSPEAGTGNNDEARA